MVNSDISAQSDVVFENPFQIEDLQVFDRETMHSMFSIGQVEQTSKLLAQSLHGVAPSLVRRVQQSLPPEQQRLFQQEVQRPLSSSQIKVARQHVLNKLFWELIYWKTPEFYEELTEGEHLHQGIFQSLEPQLRGKVVLDAGAGSGRASFECIRYGAALVQAVEPSPGLLHLLQKKIQQHGIAQQIVAATGRFDRLPLADHSVDTAISCSAFTAMDEQGGEPGLVEFKRVTRPDGTIIVIWPRTEDHGWFTAHGFQYVSLPVEDEMCVHFRSLNSAFECAHLFYAHNPAVTRYLEQTHKAEVPFSVIGMNPPCDYFWLMLEALKKE
ncbi:class I SAM-dependent methyltransferase [Dictyobacter arantiisoli]|uniref:Methyltransferase domain-containing protein n=1 Tax=Dictyobacter arantiisoli TaxID=2014874 RepID=A0A5A5T9I6_9CHLR|nr:class I SAM-dependent methyltransferase [Dictyobacter arantiisoli]GCF08161.1 hypothetical protein KDI_17250 [Dictyobacter arantiisoli]